MRLASIPNECFITCGIYLFSTLSKPNETNKDHQLKSVAIKRTTRANDRPNLSIHEQRESQTKKKTVTNQIIKSILQISKPNRI